MWIVDIQVKIDGQWISLDSVGNHVESTFELTSGPSSGTHVIEVFNDDQASLIVRSIAMQVKPDVLIRVGQSSPTGQVDWTTFNYFVFKTDSAVFGTGRQLIIETGDVIQAWSNVTQARPFHSRVSDIISRLVNESGFNPVVEPTRGTWSQIQAFEDTWEFVRRMQFKAINDSGQGGYLIFTRQTDVHFHTVGFSPTIHSLNAMSLTLWQSTSEPFQLIQEAAGGVSVIGYAMESGQTFNLKSDALVSPKMASQLPFIATGNYPSLLTQVPLDVGASGTDELQARAQVMYDMARLHLFQSSFAIESTIVFPGDHLNINITQASGATDPMSGLWINLESKLVVKDGALTSFCLVGRGEIQGSSASKLTGRPPNSVNGQSPGRPVTLTPTATGVLAIPIASQ